MQYDEYDFKNPVNDAYESTGQPAVFCKDCVHYYRSFGMVISQVDARCRRTHEPEVDLVSGRLTGPRHTDMIKCSTMRNPGSGCGKYGKWWKPKKETKEMTMLLLRRKVEE